MSLEDIKRDILKASGEDEPEVADFVVDLHRNSSSFEEFKASLDEMGAEFTSEFLSKIHGLLSTLENSTASLKKEEEEEIQIPREERRPNDVLSLPNDANVIKEEDKYDGDNLLSQWKDFKKEEQHLDGTDVKIPRERSRSPQRRNHYNDNLRDRDHQLDPEPIVGKVYRGFVRNITNFGAFVNLIGVRGRVSGLLHISQIDQQRINHPSDILKFDQEVYVQVLKIDGHRINLSMKDVDQTTGEIIHQEDFEQRGRKLYVSTAKDVKKRMTSPERWEIRQLIAAGALSAKDYPELNDTNLDNDNNGNDDDFGQAETEINVEVKQKIPPFMKGFESSLIGITPLKVEKLPEGSLTRVAMNGSELAKETRAQRIKQIREEHKSKRQTNNNNISDDPLLNHRKIEEVDLSKSGEKQFKHVSYGKRTNLSMKEQRESLPVFKMRDHLIQQVRENQFVVIVGETGSGKTTQLTQYLNEAGFSEDGIIGCTQPRRVAATSVAKRVAEEMDVRLGQEVGYTVRFDEKTSPNTRIKYMTDGMLQREALLDPEMSKYSVIMLDEAHERTIATDVLFALLKKAAKTRPDLKIIVTSATLDSSKFSNYFNNCPIIEIPGRTYPVEVLYTKEPEFDYLQAAIESILQIHISEPEGDILVFLTGQEEIETSVQVLSEKIKSMNDDTIQELIILPVYSALPTEMQSRIFDPTPKGSRKVILATNIAETSLTIDGIFYVIDPGFAKINAYDPKLGMDSLVVRPISQAQANQRSGRAGRTGPGKCYRLYTELAYKNEMSPNTIPEIQRQNLSNTILMLKAIGINDLLNFEFMDPPKRESIMISLNDLYYLKAVDDESRITTIGRNLVNIPADPTISKTLIESIHYKCSDDMITIFSMVTTPNIFYRSKEHQEMADRKKARFNHPHGDHLTYLNIYNAWVNSDYSRDWCKENFIQERSLKRAQDIRIQLVRIFKKFKYPIISCGANTDMVRKALCSGFFKNIAKRDNNEGYKTLQEQTQVYIHPSSAIKNSAQYVLYNNILNTTKEYMVHITTIEPKWLVEISPEFFEINGHKTVAKKKEERIVPLFNRFTTDQNDWKLTRPTSDKTKSRFRAG